MGPRALLRGEIDLLPSPPELSPATLHPGLLPDPLLRSFWDPLELFLQQGRLHLTQHCVLSRASHSTSLGLSFLLYKTGTAMVSVS